MRLLSEKILLHCYIATLLLWFLYPAITVSEGVVNLVISEVKTTGGIGYADNEYVEIYNPTDSDIDLSQLPLKLHIRSGIGSDSNKPLTFINSTVSSGGYFLIGPVNGYLGDVPLDATYSASGNKLVDNGGVYISLSVTAGVNVIDKLGWGSQPEGGFESEVYPANPSAGEVLGRLWLVDFDRYEDTDNNRQDFEIQAPTPKSQNISIPEEEPETEPPTVYSTKILINEFLPAPGNSVDWDGNGVADSNDEWVEVINLDDGPIDLAGWTIDDISDGGSSPYTIPTGTIIEPDGFLVFYKKDTGIILNNTSDSVVLKNPNGEVVDSYSYTSTSSDKSFSRDGNSADSEWVTDYAPSPGSRNTPPANINPVANAGSNIANVKAGDVVNFNGSKSYDPDGTIIRYEWVFGDGSQLFSSTDPQASHRYQSAGNYQAVLTVYDDAESFATSSVSVGIIQAEAVKTSYQNQYSSQIKIIEIMPNPEGTDAEGEYIKIINNGTSSINLRNWYIDDDEGGSKPYLIDYDLVLVPGGSVYFHSTDTKISLGNSGDASRVMDPDKKVIDSVSYTGPAKEGVPYVFENGVWSWEEEIREVEGPEEKNILSEPAVIKEVKANLDMVSDSGNKILPYFPVKPLDQKIIQENLDIVGATEKTLAKNIFVDTGFIFQNKSIETPMSSDFGSSPSIDIGESGSGNKYYFHSRIFIISYAVLSIFLVCQFIILPRNIRPVLDRIYKGLAQDNPKEKSSLEDLFK